MLKHPRGRRPLLVSIHPRTPCVRPCDGCRASRARVPVFALGDQPRARRGENSSTSAVEGNDTAPAAGASSPPPPRRARGLARRRCPSRRSGAQARAHGSPGDAGRKPADSRRSARRPAPEGPGRVGGVCEVSSLCPHFVRTLSAPPRNCRSPATARLCGRSAHPVRTSAPKVVAVLHAAPFAALPIGITFPRRVPSRKSAHHCMRRRRSARYSARW